MKYRIELIQDNMETMYLVAMSPFGFNFSFRAKDARTYEEIEAKAIVAILKANDRESGRKAKYRRVGV